MTLDSVDPTRRQEMARDYATVRAERGDEAAIEHLCVAYSLSRDDVAALVREFPPAAPSR